MMPITSIFSRRMQQTESLQDTILSACKKGDLPKLQEAYRSILEKHPCLTVLDDRSNTPLHIAAVSGHLSLVQYLVSHIKIDIDAVNDTNDTPLMLALNKKHVDVAKYLLENKADPNICNLAPYSPLHIVLILELTEMVKLLLQKGADVNREGGVFNSPPLHFAVTDKDVTNLLLGAGATINKTDSVDRTALHMACMYDDKNLEVKALLIENGADIKKNSVGNCTPLHFQCKVRSTNTAQSINLLINKGVDVMAVDTLKNTALHYLVDRTHRNLNFELIKFIVDSSPNIKNAKNQHNDTPYCTIMRYFNSVPHTQKSTMLLDQTVLDYLNPKRIEIDST